MLLLQSGREWVKATCATALPDRILGGMLASLISQRFKLPGLLVRLPMAYDARFNEAMAVMHYNGGDPDDEGKKLVKGRFRNLLECHNFKEIKKVVGDSSDSWDGAARLAKGLDLEREWGPFEAIVLLERELCEGRWTVFLNQVEHAKKTAQEKITHILEAKKESRRVLSSFKKGVMISSEGSVGSVAAVGVSMMQPSEQTIRIVLGSESFCQAVTAIGRELDDGSEADKQQRVMTVVLQLNGYVTLFLRKMTGVAVSDAFHDIFRRMSEVAPSGKKDISPYQLLFGQTLVESYCRYSHMKVPAVAKCWRLGAETTQKILNGEFTEMILENELFGAAQNAVIGGESREVKKDDRFLDMTLMPGLQEVVGDFFVFIGLGAEDPVEGKASFATLIQNAIVMIRTADQLEEARRTHALRNGRNGVQHIMSLAMADAGDLFRKRFTTQDLAFKVDTRFFIPVNSTVYQLLEGVEREREYRSMV